MIDVRPVLQRWESSLLPFFSPCAYRNNPHQIIEEFRARGFNFLLEVFNNPTRLEDISGLTSLKQSSQDVTIDWEELSDEEMWPHWLACWIAAASLSFVEFTRSQVLVPYIPLKNCHASLS